MAMVALQERARDVFKTSTQEGHMTHRRSYVTLAALTVLATLALAAPALAAPEKPVTEAASKPTVASESTSGVTPFAATLEAQVNPEAQPTTACTFEYGTLTVSENTAPCSPETLEGFGGQGTSAAISGLSPATTYHYRVVVENATGTTEGLATNVDGTAYGAQMSFTTATFPGQAAPAAVSLV